MTIHRILGLGFAWLLVLPGAAGAQGAPTPEEMSCEARATGIVIGGYIKSRARILINCERRARSGRIPPADCTFPYAGPTAEALARGRARAETRSVGFCPDCPECYSGGDCVVDASAKMGRIDFLLDAFKPLVYCNEMELTAAEAQCEDTVGRALASMVRKMSRATAECKLREYEGQTPVGSCTPSNVTDAKNLRLNSRVQAKAAARIDRACGDVPECFGLRTGAEWVAFTVPVSYSPYSDLYCAEP